MAQEPRALVSDLKGTMHLMGANALLACTHEINSLQHFVQWDMGALENGSDLDGKLALAMAALFEAKANATDLILHAFERVDTIKPTALWTDRIAVP